jgi:hypothetical protein
VLRRAPGIRLSGGNASYELLMDKLLDTIPVELRFLAGAKDLQGT